MNFGWDEPTVLFYFLNVLIQKFKLLKQLFEKAGEKLD